MNIKEYWDKKIIEWEDSMHVGRGLSFIEKLASFFRKPLGYRSDAVLKMLATIANGKDILELGCGSGFFAFKLYDEVHPRHITGIDISIQAIKRAEAKVKERGLEEVFTFLTREGVNADFSETDIVIGLGFLDYLTLPEISEIFKKIKSKYFIFTFSEKKFSWLRYIHILYLLSQNCPKHFYYTKADIRVAIGNSLGELKFISSKEMSFGCIVHNLSQ